MAVREPMRQFFVAALLLTFAGCTDDSLEQPSREPAESVTPPSAQPAAVVPVADSYFPPTHLSLNECQGFNAKHLANSDLAGAEPPSGWGPGPTPLTEIFVQGFECQKISIGPFERGPIDFLMEVHGNRDPPESCRSGATYTSSEVIVQVWINDVELVSYFEETLGMPARFGEINLVRESAGPLVIHTWMLKTPDGEDVSTLQFVTNEAADSYSPSVYRRFWETPDRAIGYLDFSSDVRISSSDPPIVTGTLEQPFLQATGSAFLGEGNFRPSVSVEAPIFRYGDMECLEPL